MVSIVSIMWVWWNRFLLDERCKTWMQHSSHIYSSPPHSSPAHSHPHIWATAPHSSSHSSPHTCTASAEFLSNSDWHKWLVIPSHTVHVHTLYLFWGLDVTTLKVIDLTEQQEQPRQHIYWNRFQSNVLNTSVNVCRHWVGKQEYIELNM